MPRTGETRRTGSAPTTLPLVERAERNQPRLAIVDDQGSFTYGRVLADSAVVARVLLGSERDLCERPMAFLCAPGYGYVAAQWGIWRAGGIAVPLAVSHPEAELDAAIERCGADTLVADRAMLPRVEPIAAARGLRLVELEAALAEPGRRTGAVADGGAAGDAVHGREPTAGAGPGAGGSEGLPPVDADRLAIIFSTSGTTGRPKGAVWTHAALEAQVEALTGAWEWRADDRILSVLPLHHVHGVINVLTTAMWNGACCELLPRFDAGVTCSRLASGEITVFMAVPTIYVKLIDAWRRMPKDRRDETSKALREMRLMVSGSAALPVEVLERWREISGHTLLERYGMTEIGMALSNPLVGKRVPAAVGQPLPGVSVRLVDESGAAVRHGTPGELEVRGPGLFSHYWRDPGATAQAFRDGWFRTGDVAVLDHGTYRILGRQSVDIIKTGGYKVSALEIEDALLGNPDVAECAVVGVPDPEWGERVTAAIVQRPGADLTVERLRGWAAKRLAPYKVPSRVHFVDELPRNALGKVVKPDLSRALQAG
jgi:malonyl-CoA/methylmalonyl-CoA synthetase